MLSTTGGICLASYHTLTRAHLRTYGPMDHGRVYSARLARSPRDRPSAGAWHVASVYARLLCAVALMEGMALAKTLALNEPTKPDYHAVPSAVFSHPEISVVVGQGL